MHIKEKISKFGTISKYRKKPEIWVVVKLTVSNSRTSVLNPKMFQKSGTVVYHGCEGPISKDQSYHVWHLLDHLHTLSRDKRFRIQCLGLMNNKFNKRNCDWRICVMCFADVKFPYFKDLFHNIVNTWEKLKGKIMLSRVFCLFFLNQ